MTARDDVPRLVSRSKAALMLGIPGPHVSRLVNSGRLVPVPIEGTAAAYVYDEVLALSTELELERAARREARDG